MKFKGNVIEFGDLFCGGGGASTGMETAFAEQGLKSRGFAINHWHIAVGTYAVNHPNVHVYCMGVEQAVPKKMVPGGHLDFLWASPSCTHFSRARGGCPLKEQMRSQPELVPFFLRSLDVSVLVVENVPEFLLWVPLTTDKKPMKHQIKLVDAKTVHCATPDIGKIRVGSCFRAWVESIVALNYTVEWKIVNCADYGDATTRKRFFLKAVKRGRGKIRWPEPTHARTPGTDVFNWNLKKWRGAGEILDLSDTGKSIFGRKHPLAANTLRRIAVGLRKYNGIEFQMDMLGADKGDESRVRTLSDPLPPQHAGGNRTAIVRPFIVRLNRNGNAENVEDPLSTVMAGGEHHILCQPFIVRAQRGCYAESLEEPLSSQQAHTVHHAVCTPLILDHFRNGEATDGSRPLGAQTTHDRYSVVTPLILGQQSGAVPRPIDEPCPTIACGGAERLITPVIIDGGDLSHLPRLPDGRYLDIRIRMLKPSELAAAHSFPKDYVLTGNRTEQIRQIGNSVPVRTAAAMIRAQLEAA